MNKKSFFYLTTFAGAAYGIYAAYKYFSSKNEKKVYYIEDQSDFVNQKEKKEEEEEFNKISLTSTLRKLDNSISVDKFVEILKEVNKEFTKVCVCYYFIVIKSIGTIYER